VASAPAAGVSAELPVGQLTDRRLPADAGMVAPGFRPVL